MIKINMDRGFVFMRENSECKKIFDIVNFSDTKNLIHYLNRPYNSLMVINGNQYSTENLLDNG